MTSEKNRITALSTFAEHLLFYSHASKDYEREILNYGLKEAYGKDIIFSHIEIHILSAVRENPGISAQELAAKYFRSKGAISQIIKRLEKEGLLTKEKNMSNERVNNLFVTPMGQVACKNHALQEEHIFQRPEFLSLSLEDVQKADEILMIYFKSLTKRTEEYEKKKKKKEP